MDEKLREKIFSGNDTATALSQLEEIREEEPEIAEAICLAIEHIHGTYSDKYAKGINEIDTKKMLYGANGAAINAYQVERYLQRYLTHNSVKSFLVKDLLKGIHYLIFETTRRIKNKDVTLNEPKI